jgi:cytidylate kinase
MPSNSVGMKKKIIIAFDGHSSCGKSTLARDLAKKISYIYIDTGAMYRAITLKVIKKGISINNPKAIEKMLYGTKIEFRLIDGENHLFMDGQDVENQIRLPEVATLVSPVSEISSVRQFLVKLQQKSGEKKGVVMEGRDIGTVVFPKAELKFFVTADLKVRSKRRYEELQNMGTEISLRDVESNLSERDYIDSNRTDSPLKRAENAILVDTTGHTRESQLEFVYDIAKKMIDSFS